MQGKRLSAGDEVEAMCTRCRELTNHTIVAMVGERPARVECNTCGGVHNYRPPKSPKAPSPGRTAKKAPARKSRRDPAAAEREEWTALSETMDRERAIPYSMEKSYRVEDLVDHPVFGLGVVQRVVAPNKIEVLFEEGKKLLRCG